MALKVIGAGFGRTGTLSMKAALERLGYNKCHHMIEVFASGDQVNQWHKLAEGAPPDWDAVFQGFEASVDFPSSAYWRELAAHYPDAKVILTTRSFESWYKSASETIYAVSAAMPGWMKLVPRGKKIDRLVDGNVWQRVFHGKFEDKEYTRKIFEQHEANVKAAFPSERLLVFEPKQGWEPLCAFLAKEVPEGAFPRVNDTAEFHRNIALMKRMQLVPYVAAGVAILVAALAVYAFH
jgi:hypothetical protein